MSLIACTLNHSYPLLVGDILFTSKQRLPQPINIPTFLKPIDDLLPPSQKAFPYCLRQKIYIIADNLCIALAGVHGEMETMLLAIKNHFNYKEPTILELDDFLLSFDKKEFIESAYFILLAEKENKKTKIYTKKLGNWDYVENSILEGMYAIGTGSQDFINQLQKNASYSFSGSMSQQEKVIAINSLSLVELLAREKFTGATLTDYWGAGFEIIYYDGLRFKKVGDLIYLIWKGKIDESNEFKCSPVLLLEFTYRLNILLITCSDFLSFQRYPILPMDERKENLDLEKLSKMPVFQSSTICSCYVIELPDNSFFTPCVFSGNRNTGEAGFYSIVFEKDGTLGVKVDQNVHEYINKQILEKLK
jgi:hypothetical protein